MATILHSVTLQQSFNFFFRPSKDLSILKPTSDTKPTSSRLAAVRSLRFDSVFDQFKMAKVPSARRMSASEGGYDEEGSQAFEQEAFISTNYSSAITVDGFESTLNRLSKWVVVALFVVVILGRHDGGSIWAAMGSVINVILSLVLKRILNQERPIATLRSDPGMPSSHAQSISFMVVFTILSIVGWYGVNVLTVIFSGLVLSLGSYLSWLRVSQKLHTISQVLVGALLGTFFVGLWYWLWRALVLEAFNSILWVRAMVIVGAVGFFLGFLAHVVRYREDR